MAIIQFENGKRVKFDGVPTPDDIEEIAASFGTPQQEAPNTYGASFKFNQGKETALSAGLKATGNLPSSAYNLGKNVVDMAAHPIRTATGIGNAFLGGIGKIGEKLTGVNIASPEEKETASSFGQALNERYGTSFGPQKFSIDNFLNTLAKTAVEDPVGLGTDILGVAGGGAALAGKGSTLAKGISATAETVTKPLSATAKGIKQATSGTTRFSTAQASGLAPETISSIIKNPEAFSKQAQNTVSRRSIADEVAEALGKRSDDLESTGKFYEPVRAAKSPVKVEPVFLENAFKNTAKVDIVDGKIVPNSTSKLRTPSDIRAIQSTFDFWDPYIKRGYLTSDEFLNLRNDLDQVAHFDRQVGKSMPVERVAQAVRTELNTQYRPMVKGLEDLDASFSTQQGDFKRLSKNLIDRDGNLTDSAINRIANASGKGKDILVERLEEISPGITDKIKLLKAVEDIQATVGNKVGTYVRSGLLTGGAIGGVALGMLNPWLILATLLSIPELAVPILRGIGMADAKIKTVLELVGKPLTAINNAPETGLAPLAQAAEDKLQKSGFQLGNSIRDVNSVNGASQSPDGSTPNNGDSSWPTTASKPSKAGSTSTGNVPIERGGVSAQKANTSVPFDARTLAGDNPSPFFEDYDWKLERRSLGSLTPNPKNFDNFAKDDALIDDYATAIKRGDNMPPIMIDKNGKIIDGNNRFEAYQRAGITDIPVLVSKGKGTGKVDGLSSPSIPKELEPLAAEARKYKSAEEFVSKNQDRGLGRQILDAASPWDNSRKYKHYDYRIEQKKVDDIAPLFDPKAHDRPTIQEYTEAIKNGDVFPLVTLDKNGEVINGFHRLQAYKAAGVDEIPVLIATGEAKYADPRITNLTDFYNKVKGIKKDDE